MFRRLKNRCDVLPSLVWRLLKVHVIFSRASNSLVDFRTVPSAAQQFISPLPSRSMWRRMRSISTFSTSMGLCINMS